MHEEHNIKFCTHVLATVSCEVKFCSFLQCVTADPDGQKRALVIGGGIANFTDVAATFNGIIRALKEKVVKTKSFSVFIVYVLSPVKNYSI